jgi:tyrosine-protein kinase Etk/Wzc
MKQVNSLPGSSDDRAGAETFVDSRTVLSGEITIPELALLLLVRRRAIVRSTVLAAVIGVVVALLLPNVYTGRSVILTPNPPDSAAAALAGPLGQLSSFASTATALGLTDPNDVYVAMLGSESVARAVINRFGLWDVYGKSTWKDTLRAFESDLRVTSGHDGTIAIEFDDRDPKRAAAVANGVVEEFQKLSQALGVSEATQRRIYLGKQFETAKDQLVAAEIALKKAQEKTGVLDLDKQALAIVTMIADLRGQIAAQEVLVQGLRTGSTERNPDVVRAEGLLTAMQQQLASLERTAKGGEGDIFISTKHLPVSALDYLRRYRDVKYYEAICDVLGKQYDAAVADESTHGDILQVVDKATPPDQKSKPKRALIVLAFSLVGGFAACTWILGTAVLAGIEQDPVKGPKVRSLREKLNPAGGLAAAWRAVRQRLFFFRRG